MGFTYPDTRVLPTAQLLMKCLNEAVLANPFPPAVVGFRTGTEGEPLSGTATDECCNGAAFLRVVRTFPSWGVPAPAATSVSCAQPQGVEFELSMWRCAAIGTQQLVPSQAAWDQLNTDLLNDRSTMMDAICCFIAAREARSVVYGEWQVVSAEGGCAGSTMSVLADLTKGLR